eukprot:gene5948-6552_t
MLQGILIITLLLLSSAYHHPRSSWRRSYRFKLSDEKDEGDINYEELFKTSPEVEETKQKVQELLSTVAPKSIQDKTNATLDEIEAELSKLMRAANTSFGTFSHSLDPLLAKLDRGEMADSDKESLTDKFANQVLFSKMESSLCSPISSPMAIVHGPGRVGRRLVALAQEMGKAARASFIDAESLGVIRDNDLSFALRGVKSVIIAADGPVTTKTNWLGQPEEEEYDTVIKDYKGLKRLLTFVRNEVSRREEAIKVVVMTKACKPPRSVASLLLGDNTDLGNEVILECKLRGLGYTVVQVGRVIDDLDPVPANVRYRGPKVALVDQLSSSPSPHLLRPIAIAVGGSAEASEVTRSGIAAEGLLRAASLPFRNATFSLFSAPLQGADNLRTATNEEWDDEFVKLEGPELLRLSLKFANKEQAKNLLLRFGQELESRKKDLTTPIDIQPLSDTILRIVFKPLLSDYQSAREEKEKEQEVEVEKLKEKEEKLKKKTVQGQRASGYIPPEYDQKTNTLKQDNVKTEAAKETEKKEKDKKKREEEPQGGLDILVESLPYPRIRVRRCNMGPRTIVKEESEKRILSSLEKDWIALENDARILSSTGQSK